MINDMTRLGLFLACAGLATAQAQNTDPPGTTDQPAERANAALEQPRSLQRYSEYPVPWPAGLLSDSVYELDARDERLRNAPNLPLSVWPYFNNDQFNASIYQSYEQSPYWSEVNTPASPGDHSYVDQTDNRVAMNDVERDRRNANDRNGTRGSDRPGSERVTWSGNVHGKTNTTQSARTSRTGDRNGTRGKDLHGSERVGPSYSNAADKNRTPAGYDRPAERTHADNTTGSNARTPNRNYPDNTASANARARTLGSETSQDRGDNRDRWSQRPTGLQRMSGIRGSHIVSSDGTRLGAISELVVDPQSGRIAYAITGENDRRIAIPWNAMQHGAGNTFQLNMDAARFRNAPTFDPNNWPNMTESRWEEGVQGYYKVIPEENNSNTGTPIRDSTRP